MKFKEFIELSRRVFRLSKKPSKKEIRYGVQINIIAFLLLGIISFIIRILFFVLAGI
ncbi:MAG: protein translocase SEC61 complex subunit gamma [Candidatus Odinarchaeia archaeon]